MSGNDPYLTPERPLANANVNMNAVMTATPLRSDARTPTTVAVSPSGTDLYREPIDEGYEQAIRDVNNPNARSLFADQASAPLPPGQASASPMPRFYEERDPNMARGGRRHRKTARRHRKTRGGGNRRRRKSQKKSRRKTH
jgi:hypothetical protein